MGTTGASLSPSVSTSASMIGMTCRPRCFASIHGTDFGPVLMTTIISYLQSPSLARTLRWCSDRLVRGTGKASRRLAAKIDKSRSTCLQHAPGVNMTVDDITGSLYQHSRPKILASYPGRGRESLIHNPGIRGIRIGRLCRITRVMNCDGVSNF